jgi:hypothetical protein
MLQGCAESNIARTVMMLGCDDDKPHAGILAKGDSFRRVECYRIKRLSRRYLILDDWNFGLSHDPFCTLGFVPDATAPSIRPQWMNMPLLS